MIFLKEGPWGFKGRNMNEMYWEIIRTIENEGLVISPRGHRTLELLHVVTRLSKPQQRILTVPGRSWNPFFALAETVWILQGRSDAEWICKYNKRLEKVLDFGMNHFHGAYGERLRRWKGDEIDQWGDTQARHDQLFDCFLILNEHPDSRQAVMTLWNPEFDKSGARTLDRPCNIAVAFKRRHGKLHMSVFNRSNDVVYGLTTTNIVQFSTIQEVLASWLGIEVGNYTHYSDSLHMYESDPFSDDATKGPGVGNPNLIPVGFNLYEYVSPCSMACTTPNQLATWLNQIAQEKFGTIIPCPYWDSVRGALSAYQSRNIAFVLQQVRNMHTPDWKVECLRFLVEKREVDGTAVRDILKDMVERGQMKQEGYLPIMQYIGLGNEARE